MHASHISREGTRGHSLKLCQEGSKLRRQSFPVRITKVWNELPNSVVTPKMLIHLKTGWTDTGLEGRRLPLNHEAPIPEHHLAEDKAKRFEHGLYREYAIVIQDEVGDSNGGNV